MARAHWVLDSQGYKRTLRICDTYRFSTGTVVANMPLHAKVVVHCLSCFTELSRAVPFPLLVDKSQVASDMCRAVSVTEYFERPRTQVVVAIYP